MVLRSTEAIGGATTPTDLRSSITLIIAVGDSAAGAVAADGRFGTDPCRDAADTASAVPTRHAAIDCIVRLAGSRIDDLPLARDFSSNTTQAVIHVQEIQANSRPPLTNQWAIS